MTLAVQCRNVRFSFGDKAPLLQDVNFSLLKGEIGVLMGRSGSGKTTLFRILTGMLAPTEGDVLTLEKDSKKAISFMTHDDLLLPWRTALENVLLPAELSECMSEKIIERAHYLLKRVGLFSDKYTFPEALSQGMRQRVALARTLLLKRPLVLLDEPFGSLDLITRQEMYRLVEQLVKEEGLSLLLITHDLRDCSAVASKLFVLKKGMIHELDHQEKESIEEFLAE